jgi:hypothetical protein
MAPAGIISGDSFVRIFRPDGANIALRDDEGSAILDREGNRRYGHPYQMRHTFVLERINAGAPLERS